MQDRNQDYIFKSPGGRREHIIEGGAIELHNAEENALIHAATCFGPLNCLKASSSQEDVRTAHLHTHGTRCLIRAKEASEQANCFLLVHAATQILSCGALTRRHLPHAPKNASCCSGTSSMTLCKAGADQKTSATYDNCEP